MEIGEFNEEYNHSYSEEERYSRRKSLKCSRRSSVSAIVGIQFQGKDLDFSQNGNQICVKLPRDYKNEPAYVLRMTT